jgi:hypothetical protein
MERSWRGGRGFVSKYDNLKCYKEVVRGYDVYLPRALSAPPRLRVKIY